MVTNLVLLHPARRMPDTFTGVVQTLPAGIKPWLPNLGSGSVSEQQHIVESYLDRNELRTVVLAGHGTGALVAASLAVAQPQRVSHLILSQPQLSLDEAQLTAQIRALKMLPKFLLRRRGIDKDASIKVLESVRGVDIAEQVAALTQPILVLDTEDAKPVPGATTVTVERSANFWYETDPQRMSAEITRFLHA